MLQVPKRIYIAGPISIGDTAVHVRNAIDAAELLIVYGFVPYIPHLTHFWHFVHPHDLKFWLDYDLEWLSLCDALLRLPGESKSSEIEIEHAKILGIPVFYNILDLYRYFENSNQEQ